MNRAKILVNEGSFETDAPEGRPLLDFVRLELGLLGTKEGCREGDCGACAVVIGEFVEGPEGSRSPRYRAQPSCLAFVGELADRHLLTIEGLAAAAEEAGLEYGLTPVMKALLEKNGSQCGFCSPGFVMSLTGWLLEGRELTEEGALRAIDGNLCRCTGYASIRRAARLLLEEFRDLPQDPLARIARLVEKGVVPAATLAFARGEYDGKPAIAPNIDSKPADGDGSSRSAPTIPSGLPLGGGSDLAVRNPDAVLRAAPRFLRLEPELRRITREADSVSVGAATSVRDFFDSELVRAAVPGIEGFETRFASTLVRNRATVGGNIANASPIADLTPILLALGARLRLRGPSGEREVALEGFFKAYRSIDLGPDEIIAAILLPRLSESEFFNFEKLSKRENLDIATVNSAALFRLSPDGSSLVDVRIAAGGVAPVPLLLAKTAEFLKGRQVDAETALEAARIAALEVEPIDDVRGSAGYRREGLGRLVLAHLVALRPSLDEGIGTAISGTALAGRGDKGGER